MKNNVELRQVDVREIYDLRQRLLRPDQPIESVHFSGDELDTTKHAGLFLDGKLIGCASIMIADNPAFDEKKQYQMRGVAVEKEYQGQGYGKAVVKYLEFLALNRGIDFIWMNARTDVRKFYETLGYEAYGEEFMIPSVCPHIVMRKKIIETACESCKKND
ncbi:MAG TPA: GNAT family N-acetyltransferase [Clostridia bacterium]|nr:GNAT family N-acetyltransferase [Clostridia bacterium]